MAVDKFMTLDPHAIDTLLENVFQTVENNYIRRTEHAQDISDLEDKLTDGSVTKVGTATVGSSTRGIYLLNGVPTETSGGDVPTSHASTTTEYGGGDATHYGHVKLSDNYATSAGNASESVGASSKAVNDAFNASKEYMDDIISGAYEFDIEGDDLYVTYNVTGGATFAIDENGNLKMTY